jgi:hypothetical protein
MFQDFRPVRYYDPPGPFATLETLEQFLKELQSSPDNTALRQELIAEAQWTIVWIRRGRSTIH